MRPFSGFLCERTRATILASNTMTAKNKLAADLDWAPEGRHRGLSQITQDPLQQQAGGARNQRGIAVRAVHTTMAAVAKITPVLSHGCVPVLPMRCVSTHSPAGMSASGSPERRQMRSASSWMSVLRTKIKRTASYSNGEPVEK